MRKTQLKDLKKNLLLKDPLVIVINDTNIKYINGKHLNVLVDLYSELLYISMKYINLFET